MVNLMSNKSKCKCKRCRNKEKIFDLLKEFYTPKLTAGIVMSEYKLDRDALNDFLPSIKQIYRFLQ